MSAFKLGQLVMTRGVSDLISQDSGFSAHVGKSFGRYISGDWGNLCNEDWKLNDEALRCGDRILASYEHPGHPDWKLWIITEWDRSVTTLLFPDEY